MKVKGFILSQTVVIFVSIDRKVMWTRKRKKKKKKLRWRTEVWPRIYSREGRRSTLFFLHLIKKYRFHFPAAIGRWN